MEEEKNNERHTESGRQTETSGISLYPDEWKKLGRIGKRIGVRGKTNAVRHLVNTYPLDEDSAQ